MSSAGKPWWLDMAEFVPELERLGEYGPTRDGRMLKGIALDLGEGGDRQSYKSYLDASDCRRMAAALTAAAEWLERPGATIYGDEDDA